LNDTLLPVIRSRPRALIVDDDEDYTATVQMLLQSIGFVTESAHSLPAGARRLYALLDRSQPPVPTLALIDIMMPIAGCPELEGIILAAQAIMSMEAGQLHPAHIVVFSSDLSERRRQEALAAGCSLALDKEEFPNHLHQLRDLVMTPPVIPSTASLGAEAHTMQQSVRHFATQLWRFVNNTVSLTWDAKHIKYLLFSPAMLTDDPWGTWIRERGGIDALFNRLRSVSLDDQQRALLLLILDNPFHWHREYDQQFGKSPSTRYRHLSELTASLAFILNRW
jgi:CheY-like chemotaxis protein